jgi:hypothetical protein
MNITSAGNFEFPTRLQRVAGLDLDREPMSTDRANALVLYLGTRILTEMQIRAVALEHPNVAAPHALASANFAVADLSDMARFTVENVEGCKVNPSIRAYLYPEQEAA